MIKPFRNTTDRNGDIKFEFEHFANKKLKHSLDKLETENLWLSIIIMNPLSLEFVFSDCSCPDFKINRLGMSDCKHLTENKQYLRLVL